MMRTLVSYDDITAPVPVEDISQPNFSPGGPPAKRKKLNQKGRYSRQYQTHHHWDDPSSEKDSANVATKDGGSDEIDVIEDEVDEGSRELTHDEIWDDSSLIDAWNAAMEEYEAFHGPGKGWKNAPVHGSSLWYNIPPESSTKNEEHATPINQKAAEIDHRTQESGEVDSQPHDFGTFVPTHDPSLRSDNPPTGGHSYAGHVSDSMPSSDDAFHNALQATYWSGYWTAVYHCQKKSNSHSQPQAMDDADHPADHPSQNENA